MDQDICYFFTDTIYQFKPLLENDDLKRIVINSWKYLADKGLIVVYGYVIMPNHVHLLWNMLEKNGGESPAASFTKHTAHQFRKYLTIKEPKTLQQFSSDKTDRRYQFWKRDPLAIPLNTEDILIQKLITFMLTR